MPLLDSDLSNTFQRIATPALAGALGTGALAGYVTSKAHPQGEAPSARRRRILRNAMMGALLGGGVGAALPAGLSTLAQPFSGSGANQGSLLSRGLDSGSDLLLSNALPIAAGVGGGVMINRSQNANRQRATKEIFQDLTGNQIPGSGATPANESQLRSLMMTPEGRNKVITMMALKYRDPNQAANPATNALARTLGLSSKVMPGGGDTNLFTARELVQEMGGDMAAAKGTAAPSLKDMAKTFGPTSEHAFFGGDDVYRNGVLPSYKNYLQQQGGLSSFMSRFVRPDMPDYMKNLRRFKVIEALGKLGIGQKAIDAVENFNPSRIAEFYGNVSRPGAARFLGGRMGILPKLGLLTAGMTGAGYLQNKITGEA